MVDPSAAAASDPEPSTPDQSGPDQSGKAELRRAMRAMRRSITDRPERSERIWAHVRKLLPATVPLRLLAFESIAGEPETASFVEWCASIGVDVAVPAEHSDPARPDPSWPDVVIVPGLAFTPHGDRLGQGGGWYDRFLAGARPDCRTIGVGFVEQIVDTLPVEDHDVRLDHVVTESGDIVVGRGALSASAPRPSPVGSRRRAADPIGQFVDGGIDDRAGSVGDHEAAGGQHGAADQ